jgi:hypothetical protein
MQNSFLASSLTCHNLKPENTYLYFSYSRNNPFLSGSNSFPEEKHHLVVCAASETSRIAFTHSCRGSASWCPARALYTLRSVVCNDKHTAACGKGHRHNRWSCLNHSQAKPTQTIHPTACMLNVTKPVQNGELSQWRGGGGGRGNLRQWERISGCESFAKSCFRADLLPGSPLVANSS